MDQQPPQAIGLNNSEALALATMLGEAMQRAVITEIGMIAAIKGRRAGSADMVALKLAARVGWQSGIYAIMGDDRYSKEFQGRAVNVYRAGWSKVAASAAEMVVRLLDVTEAMQPEKREPKPIRKVK